jgi:hypothetical protein
MNFSSLVDGKLRNEKWWLPAVDRVGYAHCIHHLAPRNGTERLNDIHILNVATSTWTCPRAEGILPHPRAGMTLTALRGRLFLFGGSGTSSKCFHDLQILDRQEMAWLDVTQHAGTSEGGSNNRGHGRFEGDQSHHREHDGDEFRPQWRFGGYDPSGEMVREPRA